MKIAALALVIALMPLGRAVAQEQPLPGTGEIASPTPQTATIVPPDGARSDASPEIVIKSDGPHDRPRAARQRWIDRGQLLVLTDEGPFAGTLSDVAAGARATLENDGGTVVSEHAVKICHGTQDGWYQEGSFSVAGRSFHQESIWTIGASEAFRAAYSRAATQPELAAARDALSTLCVGPKKA